MAVNKVIIQGNMTRDPESRQDGIVNFTIASNRKYRDKNNQVVEDTAFVQCSAFGNVANTIQQYCHKGSKVIVEGRLKYRSWTAQDGSNRSALEVTAERVEFLDTKQNNDQNQAQGQNQGGGYNQNQNTGGYYNQNQGYGQGGGYNQNQNAGGGYNNQNQGGPY